MKRARRWLLVAGAAVVALVLLVVLAKDAVLRRMTVASIAESTGLRAELGELKTRLGSSAVELHDLKLYNLAEFGGSLLAHIPDLTVDLDTERATAGVLHFRNLWLNLAELHVVKNDSGRLNLEGVEKAVREQIERRRRRRRNEKLDFEFGGIDRMRLTVRRVRYTDLQHPERARAFDLGLKDELVTTLKTEDDLETWLGAILFRIVVEQSLHTPGGGGGTTDAGP